MLEMILPGGWYGESLRVAREHHAHALSPRVRAKAKIVGEDWRLESNRFYGTHETLNGTVRR